MFAGSEKLPQDLRQIFDRNNLFRNTQLTTDEESEAAMNYEKTLESRLAFLSNNATVSFARECLRIDPRHRPTAE